MDNVGRARIRSIEIQIDKLTAEFKQHQKDLDGMREIVKKIAEEFSKFSVMTESVIKLLETKNISSDQ